MWLIEPMHPNVAHLLTSLCVHAKFTSFHVYSIFPRGTPQGLSLICIQFTPLHGSYLIFLNYLLPTWFNFETVFSKSKYLLIKTELDDIQSPIPQALLWVTDSP